jgi:dehydrogenase/reductase SDR family protein 7B
MDLSEQKSIEKGAQDALSCFGRVDMLINNAGVSSRSLAIETTIDVERYIMEVNYFGPVALTKALLPSMMSQKSGHIVNVSSVQGLVGIPLRTSYSASKHSLQGYFDALRNEVSPHGISVTVVSPGYIRTNLSRNALQGDGTSHGVLDDTTAKGMSPESVAMAILDAVTHQDRDVVIGSLSSRVAVWLNFFCPSVLDWILLKRAGKAVLPKQQ